MGVYIKQQVFFLLVIFSLISLQNIVGYFFQIRQYQKTIKKWLGKGIIGVGQRRGLLMPGEVLVLVYNPKNDSVVTVQSMRGYSIFARIKEKLEYSGLSLDELRRRGLDADHRDLRLWRIFFSYNLHSTTKRKGALIQAVEAIERHQQNKVNNSAAQKAIDDFLQERAAATEQAATVEAVTVQTATMQAEEENAG